MNAEVTITEVIRRNDGGEVVVADPFVSGKYHAASDVAALIGSARARAQMRRSQYDALGNLATADADAIRALRREIEDDDAALRDYGAKVREALLDMSGFRPFETQTHGNGRRIDAASVRGVLGSMADALRAEETRRKPADPVHTYAVMMTVTDSTLRKVLTFAAKNGADGVIAAVPQGDGQRDALVRWFDANA